MLTIRRVPNAKRPDQPLRPDPSHWRTYQDLHHCLIPGSHDALAPRDLVTPGSSCIITGNVTRASTIYGNGLLIGATGTNMITLPDAYHGLFALSYNSPDGNLTARIVFVPLSWPAAYGTLFDVFGGVWLGVRDYGVFVDTTGKVQYCMVNNTGGAMSGTLAMTNYGSLYELVLVRNLQASPNCIIYINGIQDCTQTASGRADIRSSSLPFNTLFGSDLTQGGAQANFVLLAFQSWGRAFSAAEIWDMYSRGRYRGFTLA